MSSDELPPAIAEIRPTKRSTDDLINNCVSASQSDGKVVVAVRTFPSEDYEYAYDKIEISIASAKLSLRGYSVDTKIVMDSKCSKLVLCVENNIKISKDVHAERIQSNPGNH